MNAVDYFKGPAPTDRDLSGLGRDTIVKGLQDMHAAGVKVLADHDSCLTNLTSTQERCSELLMQFRASKFVDACAAEDPELLIPHAGVLAKLTAAILRARANHPGGPDGIRSLAEEVGEVVNAMRRETPDRVREELLDVAVVAIRLYMGETPGAATVTGGATRE